MDSLPTKIKNRLRAKGRGHVFISKDFLDLGPREVIDNALSRMTRGGYIKRIKPGLYYYPKISPVLGVVSPDVNQVADALARKTGDNVFPTGAAAANMLGLTTQLQAQPHFITTGPSTGCNIGKLKIRLNHSKLNAGLNLKFGARLAINALLWFGKHKVTDDLISDLQRTLKSPDKKDLLKAVKVVPGWLAPKLKEIAA